MMAAPASGVNCLPMSVTRLFFVESNGHIQQCQRYALKLHRTVFQHGVYHGIFAHAAREDVLRQRPRRARRAARGCFWCAGSGFAAPGHFGGLLHGLFGLFVGCRRG